MAEPGRTVGVGTVWTAGFDPMFSRTRARMVGGRGAVEDGTGWGAEGGTHCSGRVVVDMLVVLEGWIGMCREGNMGF